MFIRLQLLFAAACLVLLGVLNASLFVDALGAFTLGTLAVTSVVCANAAIFIALRDKDGGTLVPPETARRGKIFFLLVVVPIKTVLLLAAPAAILLVSRDKAPYFIAGVLSFIPTAMISCWWIGEKEAKDQDLQ